MEGGPEPATTAYVVGLGNPGRRYARTRHNCGFMVLERLVARWGWRLRRPWMAPARVARGRRGAGEVVLLEPATYMNRSGQALDWAAGETPPEAQRVLILYDDADLQLGRIRLRRKGRSGGHNGVRSIRDALDTDAFPRLKLGVRGEGREERDLADYVLSPFDASELPIVERMVELAADAVETWLEEGVDATMNRFNRAVDETANNESTSEREAAARGVARDPGSSGDGPDA